MGTNLGDLLAKAGLVGSGAPEPPPPAPVAPEAAPIAFAAKVVVRATRKGRGGKTVTEVMGVSGGAEALVHRLKAALGTGGRVEGELVVFQGDQAERVAGWLAANGAAKVVRG